MFSFLYCSLKHPGAETESLHFLNQHQSSVWNRRHFPLLLFHHTNKWHRPGKKSAQIFRYCFSFFFCPPERLLWNTAAVMDRARCDWLAWKRGRSKPQLVIGRNMTGRSAASVRCHVRLKREVRSWCVTCARARPQHVSVTGSLGGDEWLVGVIRADVRYRRKN